MGQLQDEVYRLKNEKENNQALSKTPINENLEIQNTNTNVKLHPHLTRTQNQIGLHVCQNERLC